MQELPKYYTRLYNGVTDAIDALQHLRNAEALSLLIQAQQDAEELYINAGKEDD
ncbi:MAG: hypothetical protein K2O18_09835 [Oscillospiraceae bacterium]|nr:hypothetical protein [Oscillospiraceae bacterium]